MLELTLDLMILFLIIGLITSIIGTIGGWGSGGMTVPILVLIFSLPFEEARDTSNFIILFSSLIGFISYYRQGRINIKISLIFSAITIIGSFLCWLMLLFVEIDDRILKLIFSIVLITASMNIFHKIRKDIRAKHDEYLKKEFDLFNIDYKKQLIRGTPFFLIAGFSTYLIGIGGGIIHGPVLHILLGFPIHFSTATSTSLVFFTAVFNVIFKIFYGEINYVIGLIIGIGSISGGYIGAKISKKMKKSYLQAFVGILLIFFGLSMFLSIL